MVWWYITKTWHGLETLTMCCFPLFQDLPDWWWSDDTLQNLAWFGDFDHALLSIVPGFAWLMTVWWYITKFGMLWRLWPHVAFPAPLWLLEPAAHPCQQSLWLNLGLGGWGKHPAGLKDPFWKRPLSQVRHQVYRATVHLSWSFGCWVRLDAGPEDSFPEGRHQAWQQVDQAQTWAGFLCCLPHPPTKRRRAPDTAMHSSDVNKKYTTKNKSETRMTASILKEQTCKRLKRMLFILIKHNMWIFRVIAFFKLQNNTQTTVKWWKMRQRITYLLVDDLFSYADLCLEECWHEQWYRKQQNCSLMNTTGNNRTAVLWIIQETTELQHTTVLWIKQERTELQSYE